MILVTGGAGYIGSHTCVELLNAGSAVTVFDNFSNSHPEALARVQRITGKALRLIRGDLRDRAALVAAFRESGATSVIHFAGLKAVGESVRSRYPITTTTLWVFASAGSDGRMRSEEARVQFLCHRLWGSATAAADRRSSPVRDQSLWPDEADGRRDAA